MNNKKCFYWLRAGLVWFAASALKCCRLNIVTDKIITNPQVKSLCSTGFGQRQIIDSEAQSTTEHLDNCQLKDVAYGFEDL